MLDTLELIYRVSSSIKQEEINTWGKEVETPDECECYPHIWCSTFINLGSHVRSLVANKYLRVKNWNHKHDPTLISRDKNVFNFQEKSKEEEIIKKTQ